MVRSKRGYCRTCLDIPRRVVMIDVEWGECLGCYFDGPITILKPHQRHRNQTTIFDGRWNNGG